MIYMDNLLLTISIFFVLISFVLSFLINWLFLRFSKGLGIRNNDELKQIRWSTDVKPSVGGFSFFILFLISFAFLNVLPNDNNLLFTKQTLGVLMACIVGFIIGLADDTYNTNPLVKFIGQLTCAFILITMEVYIPVTGIFSFDFVFTTLWVIGLMNSINMLDNMDGITASSSATIILCAIFMVFFGNSPNSNSLVLLIGVFGSLTGFLYFNWPPAKMYMGDTGSQFLGVFLAGISILFFWQERSLSPQVIEIKQFVIPMLTFIVPLIDTITVTFRRLSRKQSPFVGGKDHITHHLVFYGFSEKQTAFFLLAISLSGLLISVLLISKVIPWTIITTMLCLAYFLFWFILIQFIYEKGKKKLKAKENKSGF